VTSPTCWICGALADSAEHRIKKSDLLRFYGAGPYRNDSALLHVSGDSQYLVQGPNARRLKYAPVLCTQCNTTATQPFDYAYESFIRWVFDDEELALRRRFIDFAEIYGDDFEESQRNLFKYFAKSFGCRLANDGFNVPADVVDLLGKEHFETALSLTFAVNEDMLIVPPEWRGIGKGQLVGWAARETPDVTTGVTWDEHVSWLSVYYWYHEWPNGRLGSRWIANSQFVYLGSFTTLTPEMRAEAIAKTALLEGAKRDN